MADEFEQFVPILVALRELLLKYDYFDQADVASELIDLAHLDSPEFPAMMRSGLVWGSAGSIADVAFAYNQSGPLEQLRRDDTEFMRLLVRLADEMDRQRMSLEPHKDWIEGVRKVVAEENPSK